jgi:hypothetical protein
MDLKWHASKYKGNIKKAESIHKQGGGLALLSRRIGKRAGGEGFL